ncbi:MAG: hypothetical protein ACR2JB_10740 [Bryobacteraceae bacterium]
MSASKNSKRTGHKFERGNKHGRGRPEGSRNRATILLQQMLAGEAEAITGKAIAMAENGDGLALKLCMERLIPPVKGLSGTYPAQLAAWPTICLRREPCY